MWVVMRVWHVALTCQQGVKPRKKKKMVKEKTKKNPSIAMLFTDAANKHED